MRRLPLAALLLLAAPAVFAAGPRSVSLLALIADPEKYDGQKVRVTGYARVTFEGNGLYLHREDYENALYANGLWLNLGEACSKSSGDYDRGYALLEGTFDAKDQGHMGLWSAALKDVTRCEPWEPVEAKFMKPKGKMLKR